MGVNAKYYLMVGLKEEYNYLGVNTESLLRGAVKGEPDNFEEMSSDLAQLQVAFNYIKSLYSDFAYECQVGSKIERKAYGRKC